MINFKNPVKTEEQPLISVGIPTYNRPKGLKRTLECITRQTYKNLEIIISDNCSPASEVGAVAERFQKKNNRIQYFRQSKNSGPINNFKFVMEKARGEYFIWVADDDFISENFIMEAVQFFKINPGYTIVSGIPYTITPEGNRFVNDGHSFTNKSNILRVLKTYNSSGMIVVYGLIDLIKLRKIKIKNRFAEDRYIVASLAYMGKIKTLNALKVFRSPGGSGSGSTSENHRLMLNAVGLRFRGVALARILMAKNAFKDIYIQKKVYKLKFINKFFLASSCFGVTIYNSTNLFYFRKVLLKSRTLKIKVLNKIKPHFLLKRKVAIWGWWKGKNLGDNWIRECMNSIFKNTIFLHSEDDHVFNDYGFIICGGGGLFIRDVNKAWKPPIKIPYGMIGIGAEFIHENNDAKILKESSEFFFARDKHSVRCMGLTNKHLSYDITFRFPLEWKNDFSDKVVLFIWRDPYRHLDSTDFKEYIGIPSKKEEWETILKKRFSEFKEDTFWTNDCKISEMTEHVDFIVSARYHGIIAGIQRGIPCIGIDICPKIRELLRNLELEEYCIKYSEVSKLGSLISKAKTEKDNIRSKQKLFRKIATETITKHTDYAINKINKILIQK